MGSFVRCPQHQHPRDGQAVYVRRRASPVMVRLVVDLSSRQLLH
jgi:hypothetical protein